MNPLWPARGLVAAGAIALVTPLLVVTREPVLLVLAWMLAASALQAQFIDDTAEVMQPC